MILDANAAASLLCGVPRDQLAGKNGVYDIVPKAGQEIAWQQHQKMVRGEISQTEGEILTTDGRTVPIEARAARIEYSGYPAAAFTSATSPMRHAAEAALRSSETLFRSVWENSADGMRLTDEEGDHHRGQRRILQNWWGWSRRSWGGEPFSVVYSASEDNESGTAGSARTREFSPNNTLQIKKERPYKLFDGREVIFEITDSFVELRGKPLLALSLFRDVSMQRRLEEQLRQSQKMEAIGQLAGGVAHDFNNILTVIHGHASLLLMGDLDDTCVRSAQQISQAAERAAGLTRQLLTFSRRQLIQPKRLDMNRIVGNMTDMLGRLLGEDVSLQLNYCHSPAMVEADAGMMEQVLLNLAVNARDAMPRGGQLFVRISVVELKEDHVKGFTRRRRVSWQVCLREQKPTRAAGFRQKIYRGSLRSRFFTTKEVGKGTGLGLATVYGIVKQHQGWIEVSSELGKGTTFRVYIPYVGEAPVEAERPTKPVSVVGGHETILLVEDERPVRELVARVLQKHGYKILTASTGDEAVEVWNNRNCEIHLLLTDLIMPGNMNGREIGRENLRRTSRHQGGLYQRLQRGHRGPRFQARTGNQFPAKTLSSASAGADGAAMSRSEKRREWAG